jgi:hypothetical protein
MSEPCRAPHCRRPAHSHTTGVCHDHMHDPEFCRCGTCGPARTAARQDNVRVASVFYATGNSGVQGKASVSLPAEPWEAGTCP